MESELESESELFRKIGGLELELESKIVVDRELELEFGTQLGARIGIGIEQNIDTIPSAVCTYWATTFCCLVIVKRLSSVCAVVMTSLGSSFDAEAEQYAKACDSFPLRIYCNHVLLTLCEPLA